MHYYQHNIVDYRRDTAHLSLLEHGVYRQLIDMYYLSESPIPKETQQVFRRLSARTQEEQIAVEIILNEFFLLTDDGWTHKRCDSEIDKSKRRPSINEWKVIRVRILERDGYKCHYCGSIGGKMECDHYIPVSRGGSSEDSNLVASCKACNRSKSNLMPEDFISRRQ